MNHKRYSVSGQLSKHFIGRRRRHGQPRRETRWRRHRRNCTGWQRLPKEYAISKSSGLTAEGFQLTPLLQRKNFAKIQVHHGEFAFQLASRREHLINLSIDLTLVGDVGVEQRLEFQIFL